MPLVQCRFEYIYVLVALVEGKKVALCVPCKIVVNQKRRLEFEEFKEFQREHLN